MHAYPVVRLAVACRHVRTLYPASNPPRAVKTSMFPKIKLEYTTLSVPRRDTL